MDSQGIEMAPRSDRVQLPEATLQFRSITVPTPLVDGMQALTRAVIESGQSPDDLGDLLRQMGSLLCQEVPRSSSCPSAALVLMAAINPLAERISALGQRHRASDALNLGQGRSRLGV